MSGPAGATARAALADAWQSKETTATVLLAIAIDLLGKECLDWEPDTVREQIEASLSVNIAQREMDRFLALRTALTTDMVYRDVVTFHHAMNALNGSEATFHTWDPVDLDELTWGLTEIMFNDRPVDDAMWAARFSDDVRRYIGVLVEDVGYAPNALPDVIAAVADMGPARRGSAQFADEPSIYGTAHENNVRDVQAATAYAEARIAATMDALRSLPLSTRAPGWQESVHAALEDAAPR